MSNPLTRLRDRLNHAATLAKAAGIRLKQALPRHSNHPVQEKPREPHYTPREPRKKVTIP